MTSEPGPLSKLAQAFQDDRRRFNDAFSAAMRLIASSPDEAFSQLQDLDAQAQELERRDRELLSQMGEFGAQSLPESLKLWHDKRVRIVLLQAMACMMLARYPEVRTLIEKGRSMMDKVPDDQTASDFDELEAQLIIRSES